MLAASLPSLLGAWLIPLGAALPDPSCAPDESAHLAYVAALARGDFRSWPDSDLRMSMYPPSQYAAQVAGLALGRRIDPDWLYRLPVADPEMRGFPAARLPSVLLGTLAVVALAAATATATGSARIGAFAGLVAALYPQRFFISSYVNNDASALAAGALLMLALARWLAAGEGDRGLGLVGVACGAVLLCKTTVYAMLLPTALWIGWAMLRGRASPTACLRAGLLAVAIAAPALAWNAVRTGGDPLGLDGYRRYMESPAWRGSGDFRLPEWAPWVFARALARSSFMKFSNMSLAIPSWLFLPWLASVPLGLVVAIRRLETAAPGGRRAALWLASVAALSLAALVYQSFWIDFSPQGRYVLLPVLSATIAAWVALATHRRQGAAWTRLILGYLLLVALWSLWLLVVSPCGPEVELPGP